MTDNAKRVRDIAVVVAGGTTAVVSTLVVLTELPALLVGSGAILLTGAALRRLDKADKKRNKSAN